MFFSSIADDPHWHYTAATEARLGKKRKPDDG
jgi:hypothetical protein